MTFFESLIALLLIAIALLQLARRLSLPYPTMLAGAGVIVAMVPKAPSFSIDPSTCLALFIAPLWSTPHLISHRPRRGVLWLHWSHTR